MSEPKTIYCPRCKRRVAQWNGKSTIDIISKCKKCNIRVIYRIETGITEKKEIPPRAQSSGINFSY